MTVILETKDASAVNAKAWDAWMAQHNAASFHHYFSYGSALTTRKTRARFLEFRAQDVVAARGLLLQQVFGPLELSYMPRGLVFAQGAQRGGVYDALAAMANRWRGRFLFLSPFTREDERHLRRRPIVTGDTEAVLSLEAGADVLLQGAKQKWRNRYQKACRADIEIVHAASGSSDAGWLASQEQAQRKTKRYRSLDPKFPDVLSRQPGHTKALFIVARFGKARVAGASFILNGAHATYFAGVTTPQGRDVCAQHLTLMSAAKHLAGQGYKTLNLGIVDTQKAPGLARFKLGLGAVPEHRSGTFLLV